MFGLPSLTASIAGERILWNGPTLRGAIDAKRNSLHAGTSYGDLCEAELALSKGCLAAAAAKQIRVVEQTFYRWRKEYGDLRTDQAKRLKGMEKENIRLKKLVADLSLNKAI